MSNLVKVVKNFITDTEINELNQWTLNNYKQPYFMCPGMNKDRKKTRLTTRHSHGRIKEYRDYKIQYPKEVYAIQQRLLHYLKLPEYTIAPWPAFTDGVITEIAFFPGSCKSHIDPRYSADTYTLHCNFVTQNSDSGGITSIVNTPYSTGKNDMLMYITSHLAHEVTEVSGDDPRILWSYGFVLTIADLRRIFEVDISERELHIMRTHRGNPRDKVKEA
jgi:hypothetical protein